MATLGEKLEDDELEEVLREAKSSITGDERLIDYSGFVRMVNRRF